MFLDSLKRCLQPQQIRTLDGSSVHAEHRDSMSPVVQQLEKAAITTPGYVHRNDSVSTAQSSTAPRSNHTPVSPVTTSPAPAGRAAAEVPAGFAPMAYNPAAPGAPEPIAHREKTPPPADAVGGTGLNQAAVHEHGAGGFAPHPGTLQHQGSFTPQQQPPYFSGPPQQSLPGPPQVQRANTSGSFPPPPPQQQSPYPTSVGTPGSQQQTTPQYAQSFSPPPSQQHQDPNAHLYAQQQQPGIQRQSTLPTQYQQQYAQGQTPQPQAASPPAHQQSFSPQPTQQFAQYHPSLVQQAQASPGFQTPPATAPPTYQIGQPAAPGYGQPLASPGFPPGVPPAPQQQGPIGGYSGYNYQQATGQQPSEAYAIHQQVYRPTESEAAHNQSGQKLQAGQPAQAGEPAQPGNMHQRLDKYEKGVSKFFKRLDKKF